MRVASRPPPLPTTTSAKQQATLSGEAGHIPQLLNGSMIQTLNKFRDHHRICSQRRKLSAAYEITVEQKRTEYLHRKYIETLRQDHQATACVGLTPNPTSNSSSSKAVMSSTNLNCSTSSGSNSNEPMDHKETDATTEAKVLTI